MMEARRPGHPATGRGGKLEALRAEVTRRQARLEERLRSYVRARGFSSLHDWPFARRAFLECWAEAGFHRFWQVWNPGISFFVYRLYRRLRKTLGRNAATVVAFVANGLVHNAVACPFIGRWSWTLPVAFLFWGVTTVLFRRLDAPFRLRQWPWPANVVVNVGLVCLGMHLGMEFSAWWSDWTILQS